MDKHKKTEVAFTHFKDGTRILAEQAVESSMNAAKKITDGTKWAFSGIADGVKYGMDATKNGYDYSKEAIKDNWNKLYESRRVRKYGLIALIATGAFGAGVFAYKLLPDHKFPFDNSHPKTEMPSDKSYVEQLADANKTCGTSFAMDSEVSTNPEDNWVQGGFLPSEQPGPNGELPNAHEEYLNKVIYHSSDELYNYSDLLFTEINDQLFSGKSNDKDIEKWLGLDKFSVYKNAGDVLKKYKGNPIGLVADNGVHDEFGCASSDAITLKHFIMLFGAKTIDGVIPEGYNNTGSNTSGVTSFGEIPKGEDRKGMYVTLTLNGKKVEFWVRYKCGNPNDKSKHDGHSDNHPDTPTPPPTPTPTPKVPSQGMLENPLVPAYIGHATGGNAQNGHQTSNENGGTTANGLQSNSEADAIALQKEKDAAAAIQKEKDDAAAKQLAAAQALEKEQATAIALQKEKDAAAAKLKQDEIDRATELAKQQAHGQSTANPF